MVCVLAGDAVFFRPRVVGLACHLRVALRAAAARRRKPDHKKGLAAHLRSDGIPRAMIVDRHGLHEPLGLGLGGLVRMACHLPVVETHRSSDMVSLPVTTPDLRPERPGTMEMR